MISLDEKGKQCPIPIVDTKKALEPLGVGEVVETVVDNEMWSTTRFPRRT